MGKYCNGDKYKGLEPVSDRNSQILLMGTFPGEKSWYQEQYYADPDNLFWDFVYRIFDPRANFIGFDAFEIPYEKRQQFLLENRVAVWDVFGCCKYKNARFADKFLMDSEPNDIEGFLSESVNIKKIFFTSQRAYNEFGKIAGLYSDRNGLYWRDGLLPSPSSSNWQNSFRRLKKWSTISGYYL